jgi:hypothetical protein
VKPSWAARYHEPIVHEALIRTGDTVFLSPEPIVDQMRGNLRLGALCTERVAWGRLYASVRVRDAHAFTRLLRLAGTPLLPGLLFVRMLRDRLRRRRTLAAFVAAAPYVALLLCAWSVGEAAGYMVTRADPARPA